MVMVAHVINRTLGDDLPASLSPAIVNELLRNQFGFTGVIVTDDLAMGAITNQYGFEEALRLAILAGCDLLCLSNNGGGYNPDLVPKAVDAIFQLVKSNQIPAESIQTSAQRIRSLKKKINLDPAR
jgi:beta-N-acetylhexosaminidase